MDDVKGASKDSLSAYYAGLSSFPVFKGGEEARAFRRVESCEADVAVRLLEATRDDARLLSELAAVLNDKAATPDMAKAVRAALDGGAVGRELVKPFGDAVRLTDAGREWAGSAMRAAESAGAGKPWYRRLQSARRRSAEAKGEFVVANLRLVITIARKYYRPAMSQSVNDLIQEGNIGLIKAVDRFDLGRGFKFATYATWWIKHHVRRAIVERDPLVRIPVHLSDDIGRIARTEAELTTSTGEAPPLESIARRAGLPLEKVRTAMSCRRFVLSLDSVVGDTDMTVMETLEDASAASPLDSSDMRRMAVDAKASLTALSPSESRIIRWRFGLDGEEFKTLQEIADIMGLSRERIRQIEAKALKRLRSCPFARNYPPDAPAKAG